MKLTKENLIDALNYYMEDNDLTYVCLEGTLNEDRSNLRISLIVGIVQTTSVVPAISLDLKGNCPILGFPG